MIQDTLNHLMYVDDEPDMRMLVQAVLEGGGMRVTLCEKGQEVMASVLANKPQMILLDVMMEGMDGPAILKQLKEDGRTAAIPVAFLTAKTQASDIESFKKAGAIGVVSKPFDLMALGGQINQLWESAHV